MFFVVASSPPAVSEGRGDEQKAKEGNVATNLSSAEAAAQQATTVAHSG